MDEKSFLDQVAKTYKTSTSPISKWRIDSYIKIYNDYIINSDEVSLEMGCSSGYSAQCLCQLVKSLCVVDGSSVMLNRMSHSLKSNPNVTFVQSLFEELTGKEQYSNIFCSYVLEHVANPFQVVSICHSLLKPGGRLFITVPNALALSRQLALAIGALPNLYTLTENDIAHGHRRVFDSLKLSELIRPFDFHVLKQGGTYLKCFADFQLNQMIESNIIGEKQLAGLQKLSEKYPDLCDSVYVICEKS